MKVLWIVNKPIGELHVKLTGKRATGGQWMEAMLDSFKNDSDVSLVVVNVSDVANVTKYVCGKNTYYTIPGVADRKYDYQSRENHIIWKQIFSSEKPDVIQIWGTEYPIALPALEESGGLPAVVYIQGVLESIGRYYLAGMSDIELNHSVTIRDILTGATIRQTQKTYFKSIGYEARIINSAKNIIVENKWAEAYYRKLCPDVNVFKCPLSISDSFEHQEWTEKKMIPHSIMSPAADYPIKGLHMLLKALAIVRQKYPDVVLNIPGTKLRKVNGIKQFLKFKGYDKFITGLIKDYGLEGSINYIGRLTAEEMAHQMSISNVFVMSSAIENHSSTLKEAMTVGVPCVASFVGGVSEYAVNEENALLYRFEDYELLAFQIIRLFESSELRNKISEGGRETMTRSREQNDCYEITKSIYNKLLSR